MIWMWPFLLCGLPWRLSGKESAYQCRRHRFEDPGDLPSPGIKPRSRSGLSRRSPGEGNGNPFPFLGNPKDRRPRWALVHRVTKELDTTYWLKQQQFLLGRKRLRNFAFVFCLHWGVGQTGIILYFIFSYLSVNMCLNAYLIIIVQHYREHIMCFLYVRYELLFYQHSLYLKPSRNCDVAVLQGRGRFPHCHHHRRHGSASAVSVLKY